MKRWIVWALVLFFLLPVGTAWAEGLPTASYQVPYAVVRGGIHFAGSYATDLRTAFARVYNFDQKPVLERFTLDALIQDHKVSFLSLILYQEGRLDIAKRFLYFLPPNRIAQGDGQGAGILTDQLDNAGHNFLGRLLEDFWPIQVPYEQNPFWPLMMLFSPIVSQNNPDYSKAENWLALPASTDKEVDVFYLYPTAYQKPNADSPNICTINDPIMVKGAKVAYSKQATAFNTMANIYAPYYRQVDAQYKSTLPIAEQNKIVDGIPTSDGLAAFEYYIKHYNQGRPFILAGHSLGSNVMANLLSAYMKLNPEVYKRMIAAYVIGYSITPDYLARNPHLKFAEGPSDTGVIVSWNTEAPTLLGTNPVTLPGGIAINPITWTRDETLASAEGNLGSIEINQDGSVVLDSQGNPQLIKNFADAQVNKARGVVICSTADANTLAPGNPIVSRGIFHNYDYPLYYFDIRANAADRIAHYFANE
jgi:hypothetical protein